MIYLEPTICGFRPFLELRPFEDRLLLVTLVGSETHVRVFNVGSGVDGRCAELFSKYWIDCHFLLGNRLYVYKERDLSDEARYQNTWSIKFISNLGYL